MRAVASTPRVGIEGHRDGADPERADERVEELGAGRIDQADLVTGAETGAREGGGEATALLPEASGR